MSSTKSGKTKFIVLDGMDNCGKSTLLQTLEAKYSETHQLRFKKTLPSGALLRINTEKDFELLFSMFELLDRNQTYLLDRFVVSNLVYDKVLRGEDTTVSAYYHKEFLDRFNVLQIFLTRPHVEKDFHDDRIKLTREQFNAGIDEYYRYGPNYQLLERDENDEPSIVNEDIRTKLLDACDIFIKRPTSMM